MDLPFFIFLTLVAVTVAIHSISGRFLYRYSWPLFVVSFLPLGILLAQRVRFAAPLAAVLAVPLLITLGRAAERVGLMEDGSPIHQLHRMLRG